MERKQIEIYTDGACSGNPGPGGYAAILVFGNQKKEIAGYESRTTNNRMEIRAAIEAIRKLKMPCSILIGTDSQILINALVNLDEMPAKGWKTKTGAKRANCDLLQELYAVKHDGQHEIRYQYIEGHSGNAYNERCDTLAKEQIQLHSR